MAKFLMKERYLNVDNARLQHESWKNPSAGAMATARRDTTTTEVLMAGGMSALLLAAGVWAAVGLLRWFWHAVL